MVLVAHIIVDVPLMQTDRPYSYLIPEAHAEQVAIGMRVHMPFKGKVVYFKGLLLAGRSGKFKRSS